MEQCDYVNTMMPHTVQRAQRPERQGVFEELGSGTCGEYRAGVTVMVDDQPVHYLGISEWGR